VNLVLGLIHTTGVHKRIGIGNDFLRSWKFSVTIYLLYMTSIEKQIKTTPSLRLVVLLMKSYSHSFIKKLKLLPSFLRVKKLIEVEFRNFKDLIDKCRNHIEFCISLYTYI
jgi:GTPase involved in cell partitioning and DNA repair